MLYGMAEDEAEWLSFHLTTPFIVLRGNFCFAAAAAFARCHD